MFIHTCVPFTSAIKFKFKGLPTGSLGLSTFLVQTLPVYEYCLLEHWFEFNQ